MHYFVRHSREIRTCLARLTIRHPRDQEIDVPAQVRGIVANYVHSLDASHVVMTVVALLLDGVSTFHFVHDSFGCHVGNKTLLSARLREAFVWMHQSVPLFDFMKELSPDLEYPPLPPRGSLDLGLVLKSTHFFA